MAYDGSIQAEPALPEIVADYRHRLWIAYPVIILGQRAAYDRIDSQNGEEVTRHAILLSRLDLACRPLHRQPRPSHHTRGKDAGEGVITIAEHFVERVVKTIARNSR